MESKYKMAKKMIKKPLGAKIGGQTRPLKKLIVPARGMKAKSGTSVMKGIPYGMALKKRMK